MSFVSMDFFIFFVVVFVLYHAFPSIKIQNFLIVIASYVFYAWWDWRFLPLLIAISLVNYCAALAISVSGQRQWRNAILVVAIAVSLLALGVFKYFNFFAESAAGLLRQFGLAARTETLQIILPLGISFMTFQGLAYVIDVWRKEHPAERDLVKFLAFKAFFPQLVAGPIERAKDLLNQFGRERSLDATKVVNALWLLIFGYTLKTVVSDSMSPIVDGMFIPTQPFGWSVMLATVAFGLQIYADFRGYSLIAKGLALLLGFELVWNFRFPYWAVSIGDFWRRWHISLSRWLRDYLYIPLGGSRGRDATTARNLMVTMGLGGLWHGASWNFVLWGLLHGVALILWRTTAGPREPKTPGGRIAGWLITMLIVFVGWFLFRATSLDLLKGMTTALGNMEWLPVHTEMLTAILTVALPLAAIEWLQQRWGDFFLRSTPFWVHYPAMAGMVCLCFASVRHYQASFIYFQF